MQRTSVGIAMLSRPPVMYLDEPCPGLDGHSSLEIITLLRDLARQSASTVVVTIHTPGQEVFSLFDCCMMLVQEKLVYSGVAGRGDVFLVPEYLRS